MTDGLGNGFLVVKPSASADVSFRRAPSESDTWEDAPFLQTPGFPWCLLLTDNPLFSADSREILLPMMTDQLKYHLERQEDLEACCQLLSNILEVLYRKDVVSHGDQTMASLASLVQALETCHKQNRLVGKALTFIFSFYFCRVLPLNYFYLCVRHDFFLLCSIHPSELKLSFHFPVLSW